ncbi:MAG: ATP-grasp domain-containing protein [Vicinamibacterales bacterium]
MPQTIFCIATYRKGDDFLRQCRRDGRRVLLLTDEKLRDADWPREAIDDFYYVHRDMPDADIRKGMAHVARTEQIDRIVALDDFDVELAAMLREYLRVPGMGTTTARAFRDKLAMRTSARAAGIPCPDFVHVLNHAAIAEWAGRVRPPWVLKPRSQAAAIGITKIHDAEDLWRAIDALGDAQADYLLEQFTPGDVYHADAIVFDGEPRFCVVSRYATPPMAVAHEGGIFVTRTLPDDDSAVPPLRERCARVLDSFGLRRGVSHTEFIQGKDGEWYFLETSARVGGAYIVDMIEAATGINLWREWARVEMTAESGTYQLPDVRAGHAGIILSLARQENPDTSGYTSPEIVHRIRKRHHAGLIVASPHPDRVTERLDEYVPRFYQDFHASAPPPERPVD